jgi:large subunit ribosomal protein L3
MKFILGNKVSMTQIYDEAGVAHPATVLIAGPITVVAVKTKATDGYDAVQVGYGIQKESRLSKQEVGQRKGFGMFRTLVEFRVSSDTITTFKPGDVIDLTQFKEGDLINVCSKSKGKGFQGGVKRHHFKGGPRTHGQKHSEREVGTIAGGGRGGSGRVAKGKKMPGRMGGDMVTVRNLKVLQVHKDTNELVVEGSLPGVRGVLVTIESK